MWGGGLTSRMSRHPTQRRGLLANLQLEAFDLPLERGLRLHDPLELVERLETIRRHVLLQQEYSYDLNGLLASASEDLLLRHGRFVRSSR